MTAQQVFIRFGKEHNALKFVMESIQWMRKSMGTNPYRYVKFFRDSYPDENVEDIIVDIFLKINHYSLLELGVVVVNNWGIKIKNSFPGGFEIFVKRYRDFILENIAYGYSDPLLNDQYQELVFSLNRNDYKYLGKHRIDFKFMKS